MLGRPITDTLDRLLASILVDANGCWLWQGKVDRDGYARIWLKGKSRRAHRVMLERVTGRPAPPELVTDHLCRVRHCLNPAHLELVTNEENVARGAACRCGDCPACRRNAYMRGWYARRQRVARCEA